MRDSTIMFRSSRAFDELAQKYQIPDALQIKATGTSVQSVLNRYLPSIFISPVEIPLSLAG